MMSRRSFTRHTAMLALASKFAPGSNWEVVSDALDQAQTSGSSAMDITAAKIPRWRGFNLQGEFGSSERTHDGPAYQEFDFAAMAEWGFDFARLPLSYWAWGSRDDWRLIREDALKKIDQAIQLGRQHKIHINLNFHRIPGYCINDRELEPADLFSGTREQRDHALEAAVFHWKSMIRSTGRPYSRPRAFGNSNRRLSHGPRSAAGRNSTRKSTSLRRASNSAVQADPNNSNRATPNCRQILATASYLS